MYNCFLRYSTKCSLFFSCHRKTLTMSRSFFSGSGPICSGKELLTCRVDAVGKIQIFTLFRMCPESIQPLNFNAETRPAKANGTGVPFTLHVFGPSCAYSSMHFTYSPQITISKLLSADSSQSMKFRQHPEMYPLLTVKARNRRGPNLHCRWRSWHDWEKW